MLVLPDRKQKPVIGLAWDKVKELLPERFGICDVIDYVEHKLRKLAMIENDHDGCSKQFKELSWCVNNFVAVKPGKVEYYESEVNLWSRKGRLAKRNNGIVSKAGVLMKGLGKDKVVIV